MRTSHRYLHSISFQFVFVLGLILTWDTSSAFAAANPCAEFVPANFKDLSLKKKIKVSEVIRECERKLAQNSKDSSTKSVRSLPKDIRTLAYINAGPNR